MLTLSASATGDDAKSEPLTRVLDRRVKECLVHTITGRSDLEVCIVPTNDYSECTICIVSRPVFDGVFAGVTFLARDADEIDLARREDE